MVVSACIILLAFLILRFTILLSLQENFNEIGMMKAIGIGDSGIRRIYLIKYLSLSILGGGLGLLLSFPIGQKILDVYMINIVNDTHNDGTVIYHFLSALMIIVLVVIFCYQSLGKLRHISVIDTIRRGSSERFRTKPLFALNKRKRMGISIYMAFNDIFSNMKRFILLAPVYVMCVLIIHFPLATLRTLQSDDMIINLNVRKVTGFIDNKVSYLADADNERMLSNMEAVRAALEDKGIRSLVYGEGIYSVSAYFHHSDEIYQYFATQSIGYEGDDYALLAGRFPKYDNEVLLTDISARHLGAGIGDVITVVMHNEEKQFVITGLYQSMEHMGEGMRFGSKTVLDRSSLVSFMPMNVEVLGDTDKKGTLEKIRGIFPQYRVKSVADYLDIYLGGTYDQLYLVVGLASILVFSTIILVTFLMGKGFLSREHGEVTILKCLGFTDRFLEKWQTYRMLVVLATAVLLGCVLSVLLLPVMVKPIFAAMGGENVGIAIRPLEYFVICPMVMVLIGLVSAYLAAREVRKIAKMEVIQ
jgi:putative ABC transport system permease protein